MEVKVIFIISLLIIHNLFSQSLDNILLIINYNHAHYESMPLLQEIYEPYFANIVFYGPTKHPDVHFLAHNKGYYSYLCISDAMQRYPNFDGYFFLHDDCIFGPWLLENADQLKIWLCEMTYIVGTRGDVINLKLGGNAFPKWGWWHTPMGLESGGESL